MPGITARLIFMQKKTITIILLAAATGLICSQYSGQAGINGLSTEIIPEDRRIDWNPGIPGGIPEIAGPVENILDHGADPAGVNDSRTAVLNALDALPVSGGVVYIPEGNYRIGSKISIERDNIVFRGTGPKSKLLIESSGNCIEIVARMSGDWQNLPEGAAKGAVKVTVEDGSKFSPGQFAEIEQENDSVLMYTRPEWIQSWSMNAVGQLFEVESVNGNVLTFRAPVNIDYSASLNARIRPLQLVKNVGIEELFIEKMVARGHTVAFINSAYCWIRNIESYHTRRSHIHMTACLGNVVRESYIHSSFTYGGGGSGYGVECGQHTTSTLVENNVFDSLRHAMLVQVGANGNVFGYNYSINPVQGDGETNLNIGWIPPDISIHGHYTFMNLFEGNELEEIGIADWWGPAGPGNTYFRNKVNGEGIFYYDESHYQNVIGNVTTQITDDDNKSKFKLEHGNVVEDMVIWDPDIPDHNLPYSYYLDSVPAFFRDVSWPPFGPDINKTNKLPAQIRFDLSR